MRMRYSLELFSHGFLQPERSHVKERRCLLLRYDHRVEREPTLIFLLYSFSRNVAHADAAVATKLNGAWRLRVVLSQTDFRTEIPWKPFTLAYNEPERNGKLILLTSRSSIRKLQIHMTTFGKAVHEGRRHARLYCLVFYCEHHFPVLHADGLYDCHLRHDAMVHAPRCCFVCRALLPTSTRRTSPHTKRSGRNEGQPYRPVWTRYASRSDASQSSYTISCDPSPRKSPGGMTQRRHSIGILQSFCRPQWRKREWMVCVLHHEVLASTYCSSLRPSWNSTSVPDDPWSRVPHWGASLSHPL